MSQDKKDYIKSIADMKRSSTGQVLKDSAEKVSPKRRAIMTSDDDELFIAKYYQGRTEAFRALLREDKLRKGWF